VRNQKLSRFAITTLGCKVNQCESEAIAGALEKDGYTLVKAGEQADAAYVIINTCTVTHKASMQSRQAIRQARRNFPKARIIVTGCYAQTEADEIAQIEGVDLIVGHADKHRIPAFMRESTEGTRDLAHGLTGPRPVSEEREFSPLAMTAFGTRSRPFLKIQDGCNAFCSYCIVPHARGCSRSMPVADVLTHLSELGKSGFAEVVLTGIHIGAYGLDLFPATSLCALLKSIQARKPILRLRISSIEPMELSEEIIALTASSDGICDHFHIPMQSGDNEILGRMGRPYDRAYFYEVAARVRANIPRAAIGADVLIGFPGEDEAAFENTYALVESLPVTYLHVFPFSPRKGTPAYDFGGRIPDNVVKERCRRMRALGQVKRKRFYEDQVGEKVRVLVEHSRDRLSGLLKGVSGNYIPILMEGSDDLSGRLIEVKIQKVIDGRVFGQRC
jgi:threonylcarbamoyladenosine tRNA methylthiotransferase MtaB